MKNVVISFQTISECFFNYLKETIFDSKIAMDTLTRIATIIINVTDFFLFKLNLFVLD